MILALPKNDKTNTPNSMTTIKTILETVIFVGVFIVFLFLSSDPISHVLSRIIIYLHLRVLGLIRFSFLTSPTKFGFLACGVYPFHFSISTKIVTVALSETSS